MIQLIDAKLAIPFHVVLRFLMRLTGTYKYTLARASLVATVCFAGAIASESVHKDFLASLWTWFTPVFMTLNVMFTWQTINELERLPLGKGLLTRSFLNHPFSVLVRCFFLLSCLLNTLLYLRSQHLNDLYYSGCFICYVAAEYFALYGGEGLKSWAKRLAEKFSRNYATQR
jgi:hypothetical protein